MREAKYNFLQCYYVIRVKMPQFHGEQPLDYYRKRLEEAQGLDKVFYLVMLDTNVENLVRQYYARNNTILEEVRGSFKSDYHFLQALYKKIEDLKWHIHIKNKSLIIEDIRNSLKEIDDDFVEDFSEN